MGLRQRIKNWILKSTSSWVEQAARPFLIGSDLISSSSEVKEPYKNHSVVYKAISIISRTIKGVPLEFFTPGTDKPVVEHPAIKLWKKPNVVMTGKQLLDITESSKQVWGECFWLYDGLKGRLGDRLPENIFPLNPERVTAVVKGGELTGWKYQTKVKIETYSPEEIAFFKFPNIYDPIRGLAPLTAAALEYQSDYAAATWNKKMFDQGGWPGGVVTHPVGVGAPNDDILNRMESRLRSKLQGGSNWHRLLMFFNGAEYKPFSASSKDMEFVLLRRFTREQILGIFGVPPGIAGVLEYANYSNLREQRKQFYYETIFPELDDMQEDIQEQFLKRFGIKLDAYFKKETLQALIEDLHAKIETGIKLVDRGVPFSDVNERFELGFDVEKYPWLKVGYLPFNLVPADALNIESEKAVSAHAEIKPDNEIKNAAARELVRTAAWKTVIGKRLALEKAFQSKIKRYFFNLRKEVLANLERWVNSHPKGISNVETKQVEDIIFNIEEANGTLQATVTPLITDATVQGGEAIIGEARLDVDFNYLDPNVQAFISERTTKVTGINQTIDAQLREVINQGISEGGSITDIAERIETEIKGVFNNATNRSLTIARTEVGTAFTTGRFEAAKQVGLEQIEWISSRDARVRDTHADVDGKVVKVGEYFSNGLKYPLDPAGDPSEVVNCRCDALPVI